MARTGMSNIITRLRSACNVGTADYTVNGESYYTDNHLQDRLDEFRTDYNFAKLRAVTEYDASGDEVYHDYYAPTGNLEEATSGTVSWAVMNSDGDVQGTANYSVDYINGIIRFNADQAGTAHYLRGRSYNLNRTAAHVWREQAGFVAKHFDVRMDSQTMTRSQKQNACLKMAKHYDREAGGRVVRRVRSDVR